ncbi:hypothetical protein E1176_16095 [Fulvivirga sp. RKSG066]|uniref:hypothetical protein n=1 Tax=Fulvivirga aurantia TaxID=2529383 RepID=UPI0012BCD699|nr:hypothetical protein [Fulvivirga aurantia]MTI22554.1 hypothetical protein [Fulvivirga aurantia]
MKVTSLIIIGLLSFCSLVSAQVPGFMGKRVSIFLDANLTPALFNQNINNAITFDFEDIARTQNINKLAFNYRPQLTFEYLIHRDVAIGLNYSLLKTGTVRNHEQANEVNFDVIKGNSIGLNLRVYKFKESASVAPIGMFQNFRIEYVTVNSYDDKSSKETLFVNDFQHFVFTYGIGKQHVIANNFLFKYGIEFGYAAVPTNYLDDTADWTEQENAGYNVHGSLLGYYLMSVKLGFGSLLF